MTHLADPNPAISLDKPPRLKPNPKDKPPPYKPNPKDKPTLARPKSNLTTFLFALLRFNPKDKPTHS
jgi:hypothetical protein